MCYIEVSIAGNYYPASEEGISSTYYSQYQAAGVFGNQLSSYPEHFLNINSPVTVRITEAMINQQCAAKGFDAVETDLDETYSGSDGLQPHAGQRGRLHDGPGQPRAPPRSRVDQ